MFKLIKGGEMSAKQNNANVMSRIVELYATCCVQSMNEKSFGNYDRWMLCGTR